MAAPFFFVLMLDNLHCLWTHHNHVAHAHLNCNLLWDGHASWCQTNCYTSELRHCRLHQGCLPALLLDELLFSLLRQNAWQKQLRRKGSFGVAVWRRSSSWWGRHGCEGDFRVPAVAVVPLCPQEAEGWELLLSSLSPSNSTGILQELESSSPS